MTSVKKRRGINGDFGKETPSQTGTTANIHMWFAAWHMDHGHTVEETDQFVNTLRKLKWTAYNIRAMTIEKLINDLHACGYKFAWAPRLAGDILRGISLKDLKDLDAPANKTAFRDLPDLVIFPNRHFINNTPPFTATTGEIRTWLKLWFTHRPNDPDFEKFTTKFDYQCPLSLIDEVEWDTNDILFFNKSFLKKTILGKYLKGGFINALAADIREARKEMRSNIFSANLRTRKKEFDSRVGDSA